MSGSLQNYPEGKGAVQSRYINDVLVEFGVVKALRLRVTVANLVTGVNLLPGLKPVRWRLVDAKLISIGGAASGGTSANIQGLVAGVATQLLAAAVAGLTQSTVLRAGAANAAVLADGASFTQQDANAPLIAKSVGTIATATHVDYFIEYVADPA